jgi:hypothetical protein
MLRAVLFWLLVVTSVAIPHAQSTTLTMDGYPQPGAPAIVKLLSAGATPRAALRFAIPSTYADHFDMTMQMAMAMEMGGISMPAMKMPTMTTGGDIAVNDVAPNGDISYTTVFGDLTISPDADPAIAAAMQSAGRQFRTIRTTATMSNRGVVYTVTTDLGGMDPQFRQLAEQFTNQAQSLSTPLPEEELGIGARWEVRQAVSTIAMQVFQRVEYELVTFEGQTATFTMKVEQAAPAQAMSTSALPLAGDVRLVSYAGVGAGTLTLHFDQLVPTSTLTMDGTSKMEISISGTTQAMSSKTSLKVSTSPRK